MADKNIKIDAKISKVVASIQANWKDYCGPWGDGGPHSRDEVMASLLAGGTGIPIRPDDAGYKFEMISAPGSPHLDVTGAIRKLEEDMAREILLQPPVWGYESKPLVKTSTAYDTFATSGGLSVGDEIEISGTKAHDGAYKLGSAAPPPDVCRYAEPVQITIHTCANCARIMRDTERYCPACNSPTSNSETVTCTVPESARPRVAHDCSFDQRDRVERDITARLQDNARARIARLCDWPFCGHTQRNVSVVWINDIAHWQCKACAPTLTIEHV